MSTYLFDTEAKRIAKQKQLIINTLKTTQCQKPQQHS